MLMTEAGKYLRRSADEALTSALLLSGDASLVIPEIEGDLAKLALLPQLVVFLDISCMLGFIPRRWGGDCDDEWIVSFIAIVRHMERNYLNYHRSTRRLIDLMLYIDEHAVRTKELPDEWMTAKSAWRAV